MRELKVCGRCKHELPVTSFAQYRESLQSYCRACQKEYDAAWYQANRDQRRNKARSDRLAYVEWLDSLKANRPCADCGQIYPSFVMEWDHLPGAEKAFVLGEARNGAYGRRRILEEIAKCELVCANCHRIRTFTRLSADAA